LAGLNLLAAIWIPRAPTGNGWPRSRAAGTADPAVWI